MGLIRPDYTKVLPKYLYNILQSSQAKDYFKSVAKTTTNISNLTFEDLSNFEFPLPSLEQQKQIVDELDGYQKIILGAKNIIKNYRVILSPADYTMTTLDDLFDIVQDTIDPTEKNGTIYYIGLENIESETGKIIGQIESNYCTIKSTKRVFQKSDILFGKLRPALNKVAFTEFGGICSTDIIVLRPKNEKVLAKYYSILLRSKKFNEMVLNGVGGGQLPRVDTQYLMQLPIQKVAINEQSQVLKQIEVEEQIIRPNEKLIDIFTAKIEKRIKEIWGD